MPHSIPAVTPSDAAAAPSTVPLDSPTLYINRELSWLAFNERVLAQARDTRHPLLERVKFLAIVGTNLDEFFMIRVATLHKQLRTERDRRVAGRPDHGAAAGQLVRARALADARRAGPLLDRALRPELAAAGIRFLEPRDYTPAIARILADVLRARDLRRCSRRSPSTPAIPFPHISNLSKNLAVVVKHDGRTKFARIKLPPHAVPRFVPLPAELLRRHARPSSSSRMSSARTCRRSFPGTAGRGAHMFRVVRDTDMVIQEDEADDLLETIDQGLRQLRHGPPSLLQVEERMPRAGPGHPGRELRDRRRRCSSARRTGSGSATGWS